MSKFDAISNNEDILDSVDIIGRIDYLLDLQYTYQEHNKIEEYKGLGMSDERWGNWESSDEGIELNTLLHIQEDCEGYVSDWGYGVPLIRESYWVGYCKELVVDTDGLPNNLPLYIKDNIDWDGVAEDLKADYTETEFDGVTYFVR